MALTATHGFLLKTRTVKIEKQQHLPFFAQLSTFFPLLVIFLVLGRLYHYVIRTRDLKIEIGTGLKTK